MNRWILVVMAGVMLGGGCGKDEPASTTNNGWQTPTDEPDMDADEDAGNNGGADASTADDGVDMPVDDPDMPSVTCDSPPATICSNDSTLLSFGAGTEVDGECAYATTETTCASGCCEDHCCEVGPSNVDLFGDFEDTGIVTGPPDGTFDTDDDCLADSSMGRCELVDTGADDGVPDYCVCKSDELTIGNVRVTGRRGLVIMASRSITVTGSLSVSGDVGIDGPGSNWVYTAITTSRSGGRRRELWL